MQKTTRSSPHNAFTDWTLWGLIILFGLFFYALAGETLHFFNHFIPGVTLGVIVLIFFAIQAKKKRKLELWIPKAEFWIPFLTYVYAIIPEFIAVGRKIAGGELAHAEWEDIFLLHDTMDEWLEQTELILPAMAFILFISIKIYQKISPSSKT